MLVTVWRVSATSFQVNSFIKDFELEPVKTFLEGEKTATGRILASSGFNLGLPDTETLAELLAQVSAFLNRYRKPIQALNKLGIESTLDIGLTVGGERHYTCSVSFPPSLLRELASLNVRLEISAYPSEGGLKV